VVEVFTEPVPPGSAFGRATFRRQRFSRGPVEVTIIKRRSVLTREMKGFQLIEEA
jgi:hypothetical protein